MPVIPTSPASWRRAPFALAWILSIPVLLSAADTNVAPSANQAEAETSAQFAHSPLRPQDQFWVVGTRHLDCITTQPSQPPELSFRCFDGQAGWRNETPNQFLMDAVKAITVFYVPGNRVANEDAVGRGWNLYRSLIPASDSEPLRLVVWSWPSDKVEHSLGVRDFQVKAARTPSESLCLGWLLNQFDPAAKISLVGYSYGSRIITGALHVASGGDLHGIRVLGDPVSHATRRMRVTLMAAAVHDNWLYPGEFHGAAISQVDRMLVLFNTNDFTLKHYHLAVPGGDPRALGYSGLNTGRLGPDASRLAQRDVRHEVGKTHDELRYYCSGSVIRDLQRYALWGNVDP